MLTNPRSTKILLVLWIFICLGLGLKLVLNPPSFKTDIFDLFIKNNQDNSDLKVITESLSTNSNSLIFIFEGDDIEELVHASGLLKLDFEKNHSLGIDFVDPEVKLKSYLEEVGTDIYSRLDFATQRELLDGLNPSQLKAKIVKKLSSPLSAYYAKFLPYDPLLLSADYFLSQRNNLPGEIFNDGILNKKNNRYNLTMFATFDQSSMSVENQVRSFTKLAEIIANLEVEMPKVQIKWTGFPKFSIASRTEVESEIRLFSLLSSITLVVVMWFFFYSIKPVLLTLTSVLVGVFCGVASVTFFQDSIHLLTIGFGSCLVGASVDYAIHFLIEATASDGRSILEIRNKLFRPLSLGVLTTLLAFFFLVFTDFSGLKELSLFSIGSLLGSCLTVLVVFPATANWWMSTNRRITNFAERFEVLTEIFFKTRAMKIFLTSGLCLVIIIGLKNVKFNDDIRLLQPPNEELISEIKWIDSRNSLTMPAAFIVLSEGLSSEGRFILDNFLKEKKLTGELHGYVSSEPFFKTRLEKVESQTAFDFFYRNNEAGIINVLNEIGVTETIIEEFKTSAEQAKLSVAASKNDKGTIILYGLSNLADFQQQLSYLPQNVSEKVSIFNQPHEISQLFKEYRQTAIAQLATAYTLIFIVMSFLYGIKRGLGAFIVSLLAGAVSFSLLGVIGLPVNFFSVLALVIVLGLGIDYSIFIFQVKNCHENQVTNLSIFLSMISTIISFAFFSFSSAPVLQSLAIVISIGVILSFILANLLLPMFMQERNEKD